MDTAFRKNKCNPFIRYVYGRLRRLQFRFESYGYIDHRSVWLLSRANCIAFITRSKLQNNRIICLLYYNVIMNDSKLTEVVRRYLRIYSVLLYGRMYKFNL